MLEPYFVHLLYVCIVIHLKDVRGKQKTSVVQERPCYINSFCIYWTV